MTDGSILADAGRHLDSIWRALADAAASHESPPLRTPTLATLGVDGTPRARSVVLRGVDAARQELTIHADRRSAKIGDIAREPRVALHAWDAAAQVQLRIDGVATVHAEDALARDQWPSVPPSNRINYRTVLAPGSTIASPDGLAHEPGDGADHFAVIVVAASRIEWLWLDKAGHRRCEFAYVDGRATRRWLVP